MSTCRYCTRPVAWVPTIEGVRPFDPPPTLSPEAPVVVMNAHDCEERRKALKDAATEFAQNLYLDPMIRSYALTIACPNPKCGAEAHQPCRDLRAGQDRTVKHPHQPRLIEGARMAQEAKDGGLR